MYSIVEHKHEKRYNYNHNYNRKENIEARNTTFECRDSLVPFTRPKKLSFLHCKERCPFAIRRLPHHIVPPPSLDGGLPNIPIHRILKNEEDQDGAHRHTRVKTSREDVVVLGPPREVTTTNDVLEDEADNRPWNVVDSGCRRHVSCAREDNGEAG